ncbi:MAG TPA: SDR family NAD(P)-dependent oxidoreductase [Acidothermaceae bacterium]
MTGTADPTYPDLAGKVAVVTGASRGIGAATAQALAANGINVALVGRDDVALRSVAQEINSKGDGHAIPVRADCLDLHDLERLHQQVHEAFGTVDILVAFAGGGGSPVDTINESADHWRAVLDTNLTATFLTIKTVLPHLSVSGASIITMASESARQPTASSAAYAAAKAGVIALTAHLAHELAPRGVRLNCLAPSTIETEAMRSRTPDDVRSRIAASFPLGRIGHVEDVAAATLFFASKSSSWLTGTTLDIAGGKVTMR